MIGSEIQGEDGVIRITRLSKLVDMTFTPLNEEERLLTGPEEKYRQMSYEMAFLKRFIEDPNRYRPYYQYVSNLALNVSRVRKQAREKAGIFFE